MVWSVCVGSFVYTPKTYFFTALCNSQAMSFTADFSLLRLFLQRLIAWLTVQGIVLSALKSLCSGLGTLGTITGSTVSWDYTVKKTNFT